MKYLGYIICSDLCDDEDMMRQRRHLYAQGNGIIYLEVFTCVQSLLKGHCIEFKYYADGIHSGLTPPG